VWSECMWTLIIGFMSSHWVSAIFYFPHKIAENPLYLLDFSNGISSMGGFIGAAITLFVLCRLKRTPLLPFADSNTFGLVHGWLFGRLACSISHDHPGRLSDFFLAVQYPGGSRHDLGFYEFLVTIGLVVFVRKFDRHPHPAGTLFAASITIYGVTRFFLDFLRATDLKVSDPRFLGMTAAQYACIGFVVVGAWLLLKLPQKNIKEAAYAT